METEHFIHLVLHNKLETDVKYDLNQQGQHTKGLMWAKYLHPICDLIYTKEDSFPSPVDLCIKAFVSLYSPYTTPEFCSVLLMSKGTDVMQHV